MGPECTGDSGGAGVKDDSGSAGQAGGSGSAEQAGGSGSAEQKIQFVQGSGDALVAYQTKYEDVQYCFQDGNSSCRKALLSTSIYITLYIFFSLISAVTVFLNVLVIVSISHFKQLHTPTNLLIVSLAVSDLLVGLIVIPVTTVAIMEPCWGFGEYFCVFYFYITCLCASLSLGNLVLISIDRYVAVCDPLLYHSKITITRIMCCLSITWCFCTIYNAAIINIFVNVQIPNLFE
ncbi:trace amine-associated receptor 6-like [Salvelinus fontinalis]|uniref:trace amine-associated receptor 6-like n=1 Tax=Salvelinus fontinalis TaxID=8038 RepID=UPI002485D49D|nr:trace amine-associated receptor 6-like [Salvelinus fontinalis]